MHLTINELLDYSAEDIFRFGQATRQAMRSFANGANPEEWERIH